MKAILQQLHQFQNNELTKLIVIAIILRFVLFLVMLGTRIQADYYQSLGEALYSMLDIWVMWDSGWYLDIVNNGYQLSAINTGPEAGQANYAFFPLYPLLTKILGSLLFGKYIFAGLIISNSFWLMGMIYLYKLVQIMYGSDEGIQAVKLMIVFPTAFLFSAMFTESLFFAILCAVIYFSYKSDWGLALILAVLLGLTRNVGVFVVIPMFIIYTEKYFEEVKLSYKNIIKLLFSPNILSLILVPLSILGFMYYISTLTGNIFSVLEIQGAWGREFSNPIINLYHGVIGGFEGLFVSLFTIVCLVFYVLGYSKIPKGLFALGLIMFIFPLLNSPQVFHLLSLPRYILVILPLYIVFATLIKKDTLFEKIILMSCLMLQTFLAIQWTTYQELVV